MPLEIKFSFTHFAEHDRLLEADKIIDVTTDGLAFFTTWIFGGLEDVLKAPSSLDENNQENFACRLTKVSVGIRSISFLIRGSSQPL